MFKLTMRLDLLVLTACLLVTVLLGFGWYLERLNVRDEQARSGKIMRAYLMEVAKNNELRHEIESFRAPRENP